MNERRPRPDDELLSACFDGEVTAEERARAELLLGTSPAAKAEFEAIGELSQLVKALPRPSAPPDLRAAVLRAAELRRPVVAAPVRRRFLREAVIFATGMLVASVAVMVFPNLSPHEPARQDAVSYRTPAASDHGFVNGAAPVVLEEGAVAPAERSFRMRTAMSSRAESVAGEQLDGVADFGARPASSPVASAPSVSAAAVAAGGSQFGANAPFTSVDGRPVTAPGDAVQQLTDALPYFTVANGAAPNLVVMNVDLYVTDAQRSVDRFRSLLNQNGVATEESDVISKLSEPAPKAATAAAAAEKKLQLAEEQLAVFVDAPPEPVVLALEQLSQQPELLGVRLRPPLELPLETAGQTVREADTPRNRGLDVQALDERIRAAYNEYLTYNFSDVAAEGELLDEASGPVDALTAFARDQAPPAQMTQRAKIAGRRSNFYQHPSLDAPAPAIQQPVPPIPGVQMEASSQSGGINRLLKIPQTTYSATRGAGKSVANEPLDRTVTPQTAASPSTDELQKQRLRQDSNPYSNYNNVRILFVLQESAEASKVPTSGGAVAAPVAPATTSPAPAGKK